MKKNNIIIAVAAVVLIAGIGTGIFFGIRNAKKASKSEETTVHTTNQTTTVIENTSKVTTTNTAAMTSKTTLPITEAKKKKSGKLLKANEGDFENLANILDYANLTGNEHFEPDKELPTFEYPDYDCTKKDAFDKIYFIIPRSGVEPKLYIYLCGSTSYEKKFGKDVNDPLNWIGKRQAEFYEENFWGYHKMDAENVRIMVEEVFNLNLDEVMKSDDVKDLAYLYNGSCYSIVGRNGIDDRMTELVYVSDKQKADGSYEVILQARKMMLYVGDDEEQPYYGKIKVECSLKDYNGKRLWSIRKVGKA